jgi:hypothetical protein
MADIKTFISLLAIAFCIAPTNARLFDGALEHNIRFRRDSPMARLDIERVQLRVTIACTLCRALHTRITVNKPFVQVASLFTTHNFDDDNVPM